MPSIVQGGDTYAEGFGITILIPKNFRHESFEAEEAAKELTIKAAKAKAAEARAEAKDEANEAMQAAKKSAAAKQVGTKQIKKQAAAAKVAPASKPVTTSRPAICGRLTDTGRAGAHLSPTLPRRSATPRASSRVSSS